MAAKRESVGGGDWANAVAGCERLPYFLLQHALPAVSPCPLRAISFHFHNAKTATRMAHSPRKFVDTNSVGHTTELPEAIAGSDPGEPGAIRESGNYIERSAATGHAYASSSPGALVAVSIREFQNLLIWERRLPHFRVRGISGLTLRSDRLFWNA